MPSRYRRLLPALLLVPTLAACSLTPVYQRPELPMPTSWESQAGSETGETLPADWWQRFGSAELGGLLNQALAANHDLAAAASRIAQARAAVQVAGAARLPAVEAGASARHSRTDGDTGSTGSDSRDALLSVGYELDLWGGNAAARQAAVVRLAASRYQREALALVLQSEVAARYFQILALRDRLAIARRNLEAAAELLTLVQVRYDNGAATALDLAQQRTTLLAIQAGVPALEQSLIENRNALAILLGQVPQGFAVSGQSLADISLPAVSPGQPAALLERRPDIRAVEAELIAANADLGVARAALYPSVNLSAAAGVEGVFSGGTSTLAAVTASLAQSVFDGGRRRGQLAAGEALRQELIESYAQVLLLGLQEVEDSLSAVASNQARSAILIETVTEAREAYRLAVVRYEAGAEDLLTVLDSQRSRLAAEDSLVQAELARYAAAVNLYKALGGGWAVLPLRSTTDASRLPRVEQG